MQQLNDVPAITVDSMTVLNRKDNPKAMVSVKIGGHYVVSGLRVMKTKEGGHFVSMPSIERDGKRWDTFKPISQRAQQKLQEVVIADFNEKAKIQAGLNGDGK